MTDDKDKWAREIAAQCWCDKETENKTMDVSLAMAVAKRIAFSYAEGRKAAESYTEKMIKLATDEVRKCHEEIRRLEDKYARNFYSMPISLDEESAKKARGIE